MAFETFDLGRVLHTAEAIKAQRSQVGDDALRRRYLETQISGAEQTQQIQGQAASAQMDERNAKRAYYLTQAVLGASDPKAAAETIAPEFVQQFEQTHGQGAWQKLTPEQAVQAAQAIQTHAIGIIGPQQKVKWIDSGGQQIAIDETTGQPIKNVAPIVKTASPDSMLSAETSLRGQDISAGTARRGQDIGAQTAAAGHALTARGQDIGAQTAAAGQAVTARGQDITATTAKTTQGAKITETQGNAKAFGLRATAANTSLENLITPKDKGGGGYKPTGVSAAFDAMSAGHLGTNWLASGDGQKYQNIAKAFIAPILRKESGAAISDQEWAQAKQLYIPWPGDGADVLSQKAENRRNAIQGLSVQAGPGGIPAAEGAPNFESTYAKLPSGATYVGPDGKTRQKR